VIVGAARTPIGRYLGGLASLSAPELGAIAIRAALERSGVSPAEVQEVIMGHVLQGGTGQAPARQAMLKAGVPSTASALTVNKVCGSGLKAVMLAAQAIKAGDAEIVVAGGMESMTNAPYLLPEARAGVRLGHGKLIDSMVGDGLWDVYNDFHMGNTGELVAKKHDITRRMQDEYAARSHQRAGAAQAAGKFKDEIFAIEIPQRKGDPLRFDTDEGVRGDTTADSIAKLKPAFVTDGTGSVTAANASSINDGAAALVVMSAAKAKALGLKPMAKITHYATGGCAPEWVMMAPERSIKACAAKAGKRPTEFDLHEINEAFSAAACALTKVLELDRRPSMSTAAPWRSATRSEPRAHACW
jgi:acetyl-CoA C-acetyltransferase